MNQEFPEIKLIPIKDIIFHETEEPKRTKILEERIVSDGFLRNPVILGKIANGNSKFLLLDGVHRVSALKKLGFNEAAAQIVNYSNRNVKVDAWCHLIRNTCTEDLLARIGAIKNLKLEKANREKAKMLLEKKKIVCCLFFKNKDALIMKSNPELKNRTSKLVEVVKVCYDSSDVKRGTETETTFLLRTQKKSIAILRTPIYEKKEIVDLAFNNLRLPSGITRHIIPSRILGFRVDLGLLKINLPIEDKNKLIQEIFNYRVTNGRTRFYPESVLVFDD